jgi:hypothetical protein
MPVHKQHKKEMVPFGMGARYMFAAQAQEQLISTPRKTIFGLAPDIIA